MIKTKKDLKFYIMADRIMNGYPAKKSIFDYFKETIAFGGGKIIIIKYLYHLRRYAYYYNRRSSTISLNSVMLLIEHHILGKLAVKCGFSIGPNSLDYGVVLPHYGTIVINENSHIGPFSVIHTSTCVAGGGKKIGDAFYLSAGSQLVGEFLLGSNVTVAAHSLVNKAAPSDVLLVGAPATIKKYAYPAWYIRDGQEYTNRVNRVLELKEKLYE